MSMYRRRLMITNALKRSDGNINYPGLIAAWSAKGKTNDDADRATLKDLTGNGHDITLNGFAFSEMSGYGGYNYQFDKSYYMITSSASYVKTNNKIIITAKDNIDLRVPKSDSVYTWNEYKINIKGLLEGDYIDIYGYYDNTKASAFKIDNNGIHIIPKSLKTDGLSGGYDSFIRGAVIKPTTIEIEILPEYPDALVFDGVDDCGINESIKNALNGKGEYTIISKRKWFRKGSMDESFMATTIYDKSQFLLEYSTVNIENDSIYVFNKGISSIKSFQEELITFMTNTNYNQQSIISGGNINTLGISIGCLNLNTTRLQYWQGAFYSAYLFDRSLDEQEIKAFIRKYIDPEYLLPSEKIPTPDCYYDFSKGNNDDETRDTIKDYSGNGNDAVAHNFAWSGMSGYGGNLYGNYKYHFDTLGTYQNIVSKTPVIGNLKFKVTGLTDYFNKTTNYIELTLTRVSDGGTDFKKIKEDGEHNIELPTSKYSEISIRSGGINIEDDACNIDIEMLPEYPGALVFDGTDDYVSLDAFDSGFKTVFMVCNPRNKSNVFLYDQRKNTEPPYDYGLYTYNSVAYNTRNVNGTYINGIKNTKVFTKDLNNKKILINVNSKLTQLNKPTISVGITGSYSDMALYKFLGFKEALTEEQIQAVIKKYNLLDGVDEIEVS